MSALGQKRIFAPRHQPLATHEDIHKAVVE
jgi:hypothetical protein